MSAEELDLAETTAPILVLIEVLAERVGGLLGPVRQVSRVASRDHFVDAVCIDQQVRLDLDLDEQVEESRIANQWPQCPGGQFDPSNLDRSTIGIVVTRRLLSEFDLSIGVQCVDKTVHDLRDRQTRGFFDVATIDRIKAPVESSQSPGNRRERVV